MNEQVKKLIDKEITKLPQQKQEVINSVDWISKTKKVAEKYSFTNNEIRDLLVETGLVLAGLVNPNTYSLNIENNIGTTKKEAEQLSEEIFRDVFEIISKKLEENLKEKGFNNQKIFINKSIGKPVDLPEAVSESDYQTKVYSIGQKYHLSIEEMGILEGIVAKIISGEIQPEKFGDEVRAKIEVPGDKFNDFVTDINESIFKNIREILKHGQKPTTTDQQKLDEDIPLPPYQKKIETEEEIQIPKPSYEPENSDQSVIIGEKNEAGEEKIGESLKQHGIEVVEDEKIESKKDDDGQSLGDFGIDIIEEKLNNPTLSQNTISDYSNKGISSIKKNNY